MFPGIRKRGANYTVPYTILLLHGEGSNGGTVFTDSSSNNVSFSVGAGAPTTSTAQAKIGSASLKFTGNDYIVGTIPNPIGTNDFTAEAWVWFDPAMIGVNAQRGWLLINSGTAQANKIQFWLTATTDHYGFDDLLDSGITPASSTWIHVAVVRKTNVSYIYINGVFQTSTVDTNNYTETTCKIGVGNAAIFGHIGYVDEFRLSNGARYTTNFTPSTVAFIPD